jgi:hypothetical protein
MDARRTARVAAAVAACALSAAGCGGEDAPQGAEGEEQIRELLEVLHDDDLEARCETYSADALEQVGGMEGCTGGEGKPFQTDFKVESLEVGEEEASAVVAVRDAGITRTEIRFVPEDGEWKVSGFVPVTE